MQKLKDLFNGLSDKPPLAPELLARLLEFNQCPSRGLHPTRAGQLWSPQELAQQGRSASIDRALQLHGSRRLLAQLGPGVGVVTQLDHPALPLALLRPEVRQALVQRVGLMALGKTLSGLIARAQVLEARGEIGQAAMEWAIAHALQWPDFKWVHASQNRWLVDADLLGSAILVRAWQDAPESLRLRANWCVSPQACELALTITIDEAQARGVCLLQLAEMEPQWLSLFPSTTSL